LELLRGGSGHSYSISASRLGGLSGQNATVAPIIFALLLLLRHFPHCFFWAELTARSACRCR